MNTFEEVKINYDILKIRMEMAKAYYNDTVISFENVEKIYFKLLQERYNENGNQVSPNEELSQRQKIAPSQEYEHYLSKSKYRQRMTDRKKFKKLFEDAILEEPKLEIHKTINDYDYELEKYGPIPLAIDIPSFKTEDDKYNDNY
jgi:hypothetical protein